MNVGGIGSAPVTTDSVSSGSAVSAAETGNQNKTSASTATDTVTISDEAKELLSRESETGVVTPLNGGGTEPPKAP